MFAITVLLQAILVFLMSTIVFDIVHLGFHLCIKSNLPLLKKLGSFHSIHHQFFPSSLQINDALAAKNILHHALLEFIVQTSVTCLCLLFFNVYAVLLALIFETGLFIGVCYWRGVDPHHRAYTILPSYRGGMFVSAEYHALHHVNANYYFSGYIKLLDYILGTAMPLKGKRIALTGASGALGSHMKKLLEKEGAIVTPIKYKVDYNYNDYEKLIPIFTNTDILFLCHGSKFDNAQEANCDSFVAMIELFKKSRPRQLLPLEIWAVGSEIECHPYFGIKKLKPYAESKRNYAKHAQKYFRDRNIQYRHIVHSAFWSQMGPGLMSAKFAAVVTLFLLKRGYKYVPVTYTGFAFLNYILFYLLRF